MKIIIAPFEKIPKEVLERLSHEISKSFNADVEFSKELPLPNLRWRQDQACAEDFMPFLHEADALQYADICVGVTSRDLYDFNNSNLSYLFGFASGNSCIISTARLGGEFLLTRASKEALHELGRCLGMNHCDDPKCVMSSPNSVDDIDMKKRSFCTKCSSKLSSII